MANLAIVAIPAEDDYVHKISSEEIAHMTLLFLGETDQVQNLSSILGFVEHAVKQSLMCFDLSVDYRGELGDNKADVLYFAKNKWSGFPTINTFRSNLLKDDNIKAAYDSIDQFPWVPHLTLGYPETPANEDNRDYPGISYVRFDRIAIWVDDFKGVEIRIPTYNWDDVAVAAWSDVENLVDDILTHHGTKGMQWGVRKEKGSTGFPKSNVIGADKKIEKVLSSKRKTRQLKIQLHNNIAPVIISKTHRINAKPEYAKAAREGRLKDPNDPITKKYVKEYNRMYLNQMNDYLSGFTSPSGRPVRASISEGDFMHFSLTLQDSPNVKHEEIDTITIEYIRDDLGRIIDFKVVNDSLTQTNLFIDDILSHHGIKGMRWGHRKEVHPDIADVPKSTRKEASKDAEEFTRAKLFFGKGAGVRRRLIKAKVEARKTKDPLYSKAFDHFVKQTDLAKRASQARKERNRKDLGEIIFKGLKQSSLDTESLIEDILEHHGIKGMKWGVRRETPSGPQGVVVSQRRKKIKTAGGQGHPAHEDAVRARTSGQVARKSGVASLSNAELKAFNERLNLEQNFKRLKFEDSNAGKKFVLTALRQTGKQSSQDLGTESAKQVKRVIKVAAAFA